jgi:hypothetical protein
VDSFEWILREIGGARAQRRLHELERSAHAPHPRSIGELARYTFAELETEMAAARATPVEDRDRAWKGRFNYSTQQDRDSWPLEFLEKHLSGCRAFASTFLRDAGLAPMVHERARTGRWPELLLSRRLGAPAPTEGAASTGAAFYSGASWWPGHASQRRAVARIFKL